MRRVFLGIALVAAVGAWAAASPVLGVDPVTYDFGSVVEGAVISHTFVITNHGDDTLTIVGTRATCGCTTTALSKSSLAPGESVSLEARVNTSGFSGRIQKQIYIDSNDPSAPTAIVYVQGDVSQLQAHNISLGDLKYLFFLMIDLREPTAYAAGHLLGAMNIPSAQLPLWTGILPRDVILVLYDNTGTDSATQAQYLQGAGFPQAKSLAGGLAGWGASPNGSRFVVGTLPILSAPLPAALQPYEVGNGYVQSIYIIVIDVRTPAEFASRGGHFMGAVNIPTGDLVLWEGRLPKDVDVVLYDQTGRESDRQAESLRAAGLVKVRSLAGGLDAWVRSYGITFLIAEWQ